MFRRAKLAYECNLPDSAFSLVDGKEFCGQCQTSIVDFTTMSDQEIRDYLSVQRQNVCVKIDGDQLNRARGKKATLPKQIGIAATAALLLASVNAGAQSVDSVKTEQVASPDITQPNLAEEVRDTTGKKNEGDDIGIVELPKPKQ